MSKYGALSRKVGHSQFFLQKTLAEHDRTMDDPWMQMIYKQSFTVGQYCAWLARNHAAFATLERHAEAEALRAVHDPALLRTPSLEADLAQLLGEGWREEAARLVDGSAATKLYLEALEADALEEKMLLAHHFLQYNAVLSGGAYLGKMVSEKLCLPHGAPGVRFYKFEGVDKGKEPARVQQYLSTLDKIELTDEEREKLLVRMRAIYSATEAMMGEVFELNPGEGIDYKDASKSGPGAPAVMAPLPEAEQLELSLKELHGYAGANGERILMSLARELLDVSAGRDMYGPDGGYALLAGRDVTRCLATMSLNPADLDDLGWEPESNEEKEALREWREKLKAKYPVAGRLKPSTSPPASEGSRQQAAPAGATSDSAASAKAPASKGDKCPISGKEGDACPMAKIMGIAPAAPKADANSSQPTPTSGFMAGKSLVASVQQKSSGWEDSFLYRICPVHWDDNTIKMLACVAALAWVSGILVGWNLRRMVMA